MQNAAKSLAASSRKLAQSIWSHLFWRNKLNRPDQLQSQPLSADEAIALLEVRIWAFVVVAVTIILFGIVVALLYSVTFVTQPIKSMAPIDQAYTKMLNDIVLLIVGGIGGVIGKRAMSTAAKAIGPRPPQPMCQPMMGGSQYGYSNNHGFQSSAHGLPTQPFGAMPVWKNPELDESWTPGPPPTTPPEHQEDDEDRADIAAARKEQE